MPRVLTTSAKIVCPHGGQGTSIPSDPKWTVDGNPVLLDGDTGTLSSCSFTTLPCTGYRLQSMQLNATTVDGRHAMLVTDVTLSFTGFPLTITDSHHTFDDSTAAPIPHGAPPPSMPPELQEFDKPIVTAAPPVLAFSKSAFANSGQPVSLPMTFTLQTQFPRRWLLSMLNTATSTEITNGVPPDITVSPAGGDWPSPALTVTVRLLGTFMAALLEGDHHFVLTAVNFRGKSDYAEIKLMVSS
jgi:hypothetical protein